MTDLDIATVENRVMRSMTDLDIALVDNKVMWSMSDLEMVTAVNTVEVNELTRYCNSREYSNEVND